MFVKSFDHLTNYSIHPSTAGGDPLPENHRRRRSTAGQLQPEAIHCGQSPPEAIHCGQPPPEAIHCRTTTVGGDPPPDNHRRRRSTAEQPPLNHYRRRRSATKQPPPEAIPCRTATAKGGKYPRNTPDVCTSFGDKNVCLLVSVCLAPRVPLTTLKQ